MKKAFAVVLALIVGVVCAFGVTVDIEQGGLYSETRSENDASDLNISLQDDVSYDDALIAQNVTDSVHSDAVFDRSNDLGSADVVPLGMSEEDLLNAALWVRSDDYEELPPKQPGYSLYQEGGSGLSSGDVESDYEVTVIKRNVDLEKNLISFCAVIMNKTATTSSPTLYYAIYDESGALIKLFAHKAEVKGNEYTIFEFNVPLDGLTGKSLHEKVFLWNDGMKILSQSVDIGMGALKDTCDRIDLSQKAMTLRLSDGVDSGQLWAEIYPESFSSVRLRYLSSNPAVANVDADGVVTAMSNGTAVIYVYTSDYGTYDTCKVIVSGFVTTDITLSRNVVNMFTEREYLLYAKPYPESQEIVYWTSNNPAVASVNQNGLITSFKRGTAVITATVGGITSQCTVNVLSESDYTGSVAAHFESGDDPARISSSSGDAGGKSYGCFQFSSRSNGPKAFYEWLISTGYNAAIGNRLKSAHQADGGYDNSFGDNFDSMWKTIAAENATEFRSCQLAYSKTQYYDSIYSRLKKPVSDGGLGFDLNNYGIALKAGVWSRAIQHGVGGAYNVISRAFDAIGGFAGKSERELIAAIYAEAGAVVSEAPSSSSIVINDSTETARNNGLVGKYMKYYSLNSSGIQVGVWVRLNKNEPNMLYNMLDNPPVEITPQD